MLVQEKSRLQGLLTPSNTEDVMAQLGRLMVHCPMRNLSTAEATMLLQDFVEEIQSYPLFAVIAGIKDYRMGQDNTFFPSIPVLLQYVKNHTRPINQQIFAIDRILNTKPE